MGLIHPGAPRGLTRWLRDQSGADTFVETGTFTGNTTKWAAGLFRTVVSVEASDKLHALAKQRLARSGNVTLHHGWSHEVLPSIMAVTPGQAVVWLDAHWSCGETAGSDLECPVLAEIAAVDAGNVDHIVMIDDARLFISPPPPPLHADSWPTIGAVVDELRRRRPHTHVALLDDVIIRVPERMREALERFAKPDRGWRQIFQMLN